MTISRSSWLIVAVVGIALIIRVLGAVASFDRPLSFDPQDYDRTARSIVATGGYPEAVTPRGGPSAIRPPAYPMLLAGVYALSGHIQKPAPSSRYFAPGYRPPAKQVNAGLVLQALLGTVAVVLTGLVALMLWGRRSGLWTLAIGAVYLPLILIGFQLYSEPLFIVWEMAAVVCALRVSSSHGTRKSWALAAGLMLGLAWLTRSNGFLLIPPVLALVWVGRPRFSRRALALPALTLLATLLTVAPWTVRNANTMHAFVPVSDTGGYTTAGTYNNTSRTDDTYLGGWIPAQDDPVDRRLILASKGELDEGRRLEQAARQVIEAHPFYVVQVALCNTARLFYVGPVCGDSASSVTGSYRVEDGVGRAVALLTILQFVAVAAVALVGLATRAKRPTPWAVWAVPVFLATTVLVLSGDRFRAPIDPFIVLAAGAGAGHARDRYRRREPNRRALEPSGCHDEPREGRVR